MKKVLVFAAVASLLCSSIAWGQDKTPPLPPEEAAKVREEVKQLAEAFGVTPQEPIQEPKKEESKKTMPEVADKALDMVGGMVASISQSLEKVAPEVWRIMIRQQYAKAISNLIVPWGCVFMILLYMSIIRKSWIYSELGRDDQIAHTWITRVIPLVVAFVFSLWGFNRLSDAISYLVNPEFYAVRDLLLIVLDPKSAGQ